MASLEQGKEVRAAKELHRLTKLPSQYHDPSRLQYIGEIQSHGILIAVRLETLLITHISNNCENILKKPWTDFIDASLDSVFDEKSVEKLKAPMSSLVAGGARSLKVKTKDGLTWTAVVHVSEAFYVIELEERKQCSVSRFTDAIPAIANGSAHTRRAEELCQTLCDVISNVAEYDRTMIYRFDFNGDGEVIAEVVKDEAFGTFMGLSFPGMDIPPQARELFAMNGFRIIGDVDYVPSQVMSHDSHEPLDLSRAILRGVSPCHRQYLRNMRVCATLINAIVVKGNLWGLIVCHHYAPKYWEYRTRAACSALCHVMAVQISLVLECEYRGFEGRARDIQQKMIESSDGAITFTEVLINGKPSVLELIKCCGAVVIQSGDVRCLGKCPPIPEILLVLHFVQDVLKETDSLVWHTNSISRFIDITSGALLTICGLLVLRLSHNSFLMWFREEVRTERRWAGQVPSFDGKDGEEELTQLTPRESFQLWIQYTKGQSQPFEVHDVATAKTLRSIWLLNDKLGISISKVKCVAEELRRMIEAVTVPVFGLDLRGRVNEWNPKSVEMFTLPREYIMGKDFVSEVVDPEQQNEVRTILERVSQGHPVSDFEFATKPQTPHRHPNLPERRDILLRVATRIDAMGRTVGVVGIGTDMTDRKAIMKAEIRAEETRKFLATMSHEVRTPLNGILGMLQLAKDFELPPLLEDYLSSAVISGEHLLNLINNVLDISKMESGRAVFEMVEFDIPVNVATALNIIRAKAAVKKLDISVTLKEGMPRVFGDPNRLQQILLNYLSNAVKFTSRGRIHLRVIITSQTEEVINVRFEIEDTGVGIREKDLKHLFARFSRIRDRDMADPGGTGLGLAICRELVEKWNGQVGVRSEYGVGSCFWFEIPFALLPSVRPSEASPPPQDTRHSPKLDRRSVTPSDTTTGEVPETPCVSPTFSPGDDPVSKVLKSSRESPREACRPADILIAEDNPINMRVLTAILEKAGHHVFAVNNGFDAVQLVTERLSKSCQSPAFDIIFMDCDLPRLSGYEATEQIRSLEQGCGVQRHTIVALTAYAMPEDREKCISHGMDHYMTKPIRKEALHDFIADAMRRRLRDTSPRFKPHPPPSPVPFTPTSHHPPEAPMKLSPRPDSNSNSNYSSVAASSALLGVIAPPLPSRLTSPHCDSHPSPLPSRSPGPSELALSVLVVDDSAVNVRVLSAMLSKTNVEVTVAHSGRDAVELFQSAASSKSTASSKQSSAPTPAFDIIFMDCEMPEMSGLEASQAIRSIEAQLAIPKSMIVALTGHTSFEVRRSCQAHGMDHFMTKPVMRDQVYQHIHYTRQNLPGLRQGPLKCSLPPDSTGAAKRKFAELEEDLSARSNNSSDP